MAARKTKPKPGAHMASPERANGDQSSYVDSIRQRLSTVAGIDAVFTWVDSRHIVHVVSVIEDHQSEIYDTLMPQEDLVEKDHPGVAFDFHVRFRQKRTVEDMVPSCGNLVFKK